MDIEKLLLENENIKDYKININKRKSHELFFVKEKLETVRYTDTCDKKITVYVDNKDSKGEYTFTVKPFDDEKSLKKNIEDAVNKALKICNKSYELPKNEKIDTVIESKLKDESFEEIAQKLADIFNNAEKPENSELNAVEIFVTESCNEIKNSQGVDKKQTTRSIMAEIIPTYNGEKESVELYWKNSFSDFDEQALKEEIEAIMQDVRARYFAIKPDFQISCPVILNKFELARILRFTIKELSYDGAYENSNHFKKGDYFQSDLKGDPFNITMKGIIGGNALSSAFDDDGISLSEQVLVKDGKVVGYFGSNRFAQYLDEKTAGKMQAVYVDAGTATKEDFQKGPYLEIISMSALQVNYSSDYLGGEVRLAYYHDGEKITPLTGICIAGSLKEVLNDIRFANWIVTADAYTGPEKAILNGMRIY